MRKSFRQEITIENKFSNASIDTQVALIST